MPSATLGFSPTRSATGPQGGFLETSAADKEAASGSAVNALEAVLTKSESGRRILDILSEVARWRLHEQLAAELVRSSTEKVNRLRRQLLTTRDYLVQHQVAAEIPEAERDLAKWRQSHADYQRRRKLAEYEIRNAMRAFA